MKENLQALDQDGYLRTVKPKEVYTATCYTSKDDIQQEDETVPLIFNDPQELNLDDVQGYLDEGSTIVLRKITIVGT